MTLQHGFLTTMARCVTLLDGNRVRSDPSNHGDLSTDHGPRKDRDGLREDRDWSIDDRNARKDRLHNIKDRREFKHLATDQRRHGRDERDAAIQPFQP